LCQGDGRDECDLELHARTATSPRPKPHDIPLPLTTHLSRESGFVHVGVSGVGATGRSRPNPVVPIRTDVCPLAANAADPLAKRPLRKTPCVVQQPCPEVEFGRTLSTQFAEVELKPEAPAAHFTDKVIVIEPPSTLAADLEWRRAGIVAVVQVEDLVCL
jgi:hypothetical protein